MESSTRSPIETQRFAAHLIAEAMKKPRKAALCVGLEGELGAGKTMFTQGLAKSLGIRRAVQSPTFIIMRPFVLPKTLYGISTLYHFDWYRLEDRFDVYALGWQEIISNPSHLVLVEWADKFPELCPKDMTHLVFSIEGDTRKISIL